MKYSNKEIDQYAEQAGEVKDGFQKAIEELKADKTLSPVGKNQKANDLFNEAIEKLAELRSSYNSAIQSENDRLLSAAFPKPTSGSEQLMFDDFVYRLSQDTVKPSERQARINQGSEISARAAAFAGQLKGDHKAVDAYAAKFPDKVEAIQELVSFGEKYGSNRSANTKLSEGMLFARPTRPRF